MLSVRYRIQSIEDILLLDLRNVIKMRLFASSIRKQDLPRLLPILVLTSEVEVCLISGCQASRASPALLQSASQILNRCTDRQYKSVPNIARFFVKSRCNYATATARRSSIVLNQDTSLSIGVDHFGRSEDGAQF